MPDVESELDTLRNILFERDRPRAAQVEARLENLTVRVEGLVSPENLRDVLPEAMRQSAQQSNKIAKVFQPIVESAIDRSVISHKQAMVDAIFPLIGPSVRRAVVESIRNLIESIQVIIEKSFSIEGVLWRIEALRNGVPVSEIALKHSIVYRV